METFEKPETWCLQIYTLKTDEVTAKCPFDFGGPDFYTVTIRYEPDLKAIESRSLKEFLQSFRDKEETAESLAVKIYEEIQSAADPQRLYICLEQARRGGIEETVEVGDTELSNDRK